MAEIGNGEMKSLEKFLVICWVMLGRPTQRLSYFCNLIVISIIDSKLEISEIQLEIFVINYRYL